MVHSGNAEGLQSRRSLKGLSNYHKLLDFQIVSDETASYMHPNVKSSTPFH